MTEPRQRWLFALTTALMVAVGTGGFIGLAMKVPSGHPIVEICVELAMMASSVSLAAHFVPSSREKEQGQTNWRSVAVAGALCAGMGYLTSVTMDSLGILAVMGFNAGLVLTYIALLIPTKWILKQSQAGLEDPVRRTESDKQRIQ